MQRLGKAERARRPRPLVDLRSFWHDYVLGRDRKLGIELMTSTAAYGELMGLQLDRLDLRDGERVVDLGSGAGDFPLALVRRKDPPSLQVIEVDFVTPALARARARFEGRARVAEGPAEGVRVAHVAADRHRDGCVLDFSVAENAVLGRLTDPRFNAPGRLRRAGIRAEAKAIIAQCDVRPPDDSIRLRDLSGGRRECPGR